MKLYLFLSPHFTEIYRDEVVTLDPSSIDYHLGRLTTSEIQVKSSYISQKHCIFSFRQDLNRWYIIGLSKFGTWKNGVLLEIGNPEPIEVGDKLQFHVDLFRAIVADKPLDYVDTFHGEVWMSGVGWPGGITEVQAEKLKAAPKKRVGKATITLKKEASLPEIDDQWDVINATFYAFNNMPLPRLFLLLAFATAIFVIWIMSK